MCIYQSPGSIRQIVFTRFSAQGGTLMTWDTLIFGKQAKQNFTFVYSELGQKKVGHQARNYLVD